MSESRQDLIVFHSSVHVTAKDCERIRAQVGLAVPGMQVLVCGPGDTISMPVDTRHLCGAVSRLQEMVSDLVQVNQQLLVSNQEMLAEIIEMHQEADESVNPEHHLGMGSLG